MLMKPILQEDKDWLKKNFEHHCRYAIERITKKNVHHTIQYKILWDLVKDSYYYSYAKGYRYEGVVLDDTEEVLVITDKRSNRDVFINKANISSVEVLS